MRRGRGFHRTLATFSSCSCLVSSATFASADVRRSCSRAQQPLIVFVTSAVSSATCAGACRSQQLSTQHNHPALRRWKKHLLTLSITLLRCSVCLLDLPLHVGWGPVFWGAVWLWLSASGTAAARLLCISAAGVSSAFRRQRWCRGRNRVGWSRIAFSWLHGLVLQYRL